MSFEAIVVDPLEQTPPDGWDRLAAAAGLSPLWNSHLLRSIVWYDRYRPILTLVRDASGTPCAAFCARHVRMPPGRLSFHDPHRRPALGFLEFYLPPSVLTAGYAFDPALAEAERAAAMATAERALAARLGRGCRGFAYRQVAPADLPLFRRGARLTLTASPDAVIENRWDSFDAYLADRPGDDRRELARIRRLVERDRTVVVSLDGSLRGDEASRLSAVVQKRHRGRLRIQTPLAASFFERLCGLDGVRSVTYRERSGELLAFGTLIDDGVSVRSFAWGTRDRADGGRANLYFDHFLREIEYCIANGRRRLVMGKSMFDIKRRFGATPVELYTAARLCPLTRSEGAGHG